MKTVALTLFLTYVALIASAQQIVYKDDFSGNNNAWVLPNNQFNQTRIAGGEYVIQHQGDLNNFITQYINRLDEKSNFSVSATFNMKKPGSKYGLIWGAVDEGSANFFYISNLQYSIEKLKNGKSAGGQNPTPSFKIKVDKNTLKIERKGTELLFYCNGNLLHKEVYDGLLGKGFGFCAAGNSTVGIDDFTVEGIMLSIKLAPNLHYSEKPENLGSKINSPVEELTPVINPDGKGIYYTRRNHPKNTGGQGDFQDVYYSEYKNGQWQAPLNIGKPVNTGDPNAVCSVTPDGNTLLLMNSYDRSGGQRAMGISISRKTDGGWSFPEDVKMRNFYNKSTFNEYFLSNDGKVILLAVERDDSYGSRDLYVSFLMDDDLWSSPKNLGNKVNTPGIEMSPFLASDGRTIYFSSTGHPGYGKNDIFVIRRLDDTWENWTEPLNIGEPVNSSGYDAYYSVPASGDYAYFVSSENSFGLQDIYRIKQPTPNKPNPVVLVHGRVLNSKTNEPIQTGISYNNLESDKQAGIAHSNPKDGYYKIVLPYGQEYSFIAVKGGFYSVSGYLNLDSLEEKEYQEIERDLYLTPIEIGTTVQMYNVFFYRGNAILQPSSYPELNRLVNLLKENPGIEIELGGHTDHPEWSERNQQLSEDRWQSVKAYLVSKGIVSERITGAGHAGDKPLFPNDSEENRRKNRRVEFKITKI